MFSPGTSPGPLTYSTPTQPSTFIITGITRDATGAALGGCKVDIFNSSTKEWVCSVTSDAAGNFTATTTSPDPLGDASITATYFGVFYKAGSPDVAGTTLNNLVSVAGS